MLSVQVKFWTVRQKDRQMDNMPPKFQCGGIKINEGAHCSNSHALKKIRVSLESSLTHSHTTTPSDAPGKQAF